jgi:hypothetical protein
MNVEFILNQNNMTAVEWLIEEIHKNMDFIPVHIQEQAKNMELNQKNEANNGDYCACCGGTEFWNDDFLNEEEE